LDSQPEVVRIVILQTNSGQLGEARRENDCVVALERIGAEVEFESVTTTAACLEASRNISVDLAIIDRCGDEDVAAVLAGLEEEGPPTIFVVDGEDEDAALQAFRCGAADCVRMGDDFAEVLPVVALEQIRRWRQLRERSAARETIAWLERLHEAMVSEIPVSLVVLDGDGSIVEVNPEFSRAFGVSAGDAKGATLQAVLPEDLIESGDLLRLVSSDGGGRDAGPRLARSEGVGPEPKVFDVRGQRLDEAGRLLLVLSDVSESETLAKRVGELEHYTDNIVQNINSALLVVDADARISFANPTAEMILGVESGGLLQRRVEEWFGDGTPGSSLIERTLADGSRFKGAEQMITLDGRRVLPVGVSCAPLFAAEGTIRGAVAIFQDLSEIKQLQRQVLQTEKMASIGQLAAGVAHEINNPMGFIHANLFQMSEYVQDMANYWGGVRALQDAVSGGDAEKIRSAAEDLDRISQEIDIDFIRGDFAKAVRESQEGSERIRHIVSDLKDFSHQDTGELMLADVNQAVDSTANIVWTMMKHSVVLEKDYEDLPRLSCYPMQLKQVFMNLLVNAYQAVEEKVRDTGARGVIRVITKQSPRGGAGDEAAEEGVQITISDTGVGIAPENMDRIFDPFFTTKAVGTGTGLGLSTSYSIVQRHGGHMRALNREEGGTVFEVWLPTRPGGEAAESS